MTWLMALWPQSFVLISFAAILFAFVIVHYLRSRRLPQLIILVGLGIMVGSFVLSRSVQTHDVGEPQGGMFVLIPGPWHAVCETLVVIAHACICVGLLGELFPRIDARIERLVTRPKRPTPGESESS